MDKEELKIITRTLIAKIDRNKIKLGRIGKFDVESVKLAHEAIVDTVKAIENLKE